MARPARRPRGPLFWILVGLTALALNAGLVVATHAEPVDVVGIVWAAAQNHGLPPAEQVRMVETVRCESRFKPTARGDHDLRGVPHSRGLAQLFDGGDELPRFYAMGYDDPDDPEQAADFIAREFKAGRQRKWSGYPGTCP